MEECYQIFEPKLPRLIVFKEKKESEKLSKLQSLWNIEKLKTNSKSYVVKFVVAVPVITYVIFPFDTSTFIERVIVSLKSLIKAL